MDPIFPDQKMLDRFEKADAPVPFCKKDGTIIGYFTPALPKPLFDEPMMTLEELQRREQEEEYTYEEVLQHLETLK